MIASRSLDYKEDANADRSTETGYAGGTGALTLEKERELADRGLSQDSINAYIEGFQDQFRVGFVIGSIESICGLVKSKEEGMDIPDDLIKEMFGCEPYEAKAIYEICRRQKIRR